MSITPIGENTISIDVINEQTLNAGVTADGVLLKDGGVTATAAIAGTSLGLSGAATIGTTLGVTGNTSLSTLSTSGLATLASATVTGALSVGSITGASSATWAPTFGGSLSGGSVSVARYARLGSIVFFSLNNVAGTIIASPTTEVTVTLPVTALSGQNNIGAGLAIVGSSYEACEVSLSSTTALRIRRNNLSNWTASTAVAFYVHGFYFV